MTLSNKEVQLWLQRFGYYAGAIDGDFGPLTRDALRLFQTDYRAIAGNPDGVYGPKTERALLPLVKQAQATGAWQDPPRQPSDRPPPYSEIGQLRRFTMTRYWIDDARVGDVPMLDRRGQVIANVDAKSFASAALEGTIFSPTQELINVAGSYVDVADPSPYQPVYDFAERAGWLPGRAGYAGIRIADGKVTAVASFSVVPGGPHGYPIWQKGLEGIPYRTIATDTGQHSSSDPRFKGRGGLIPAGTWVFILELFGLKLPDGSVHDGWVRANDTGSAIVGAHIDLFAGHKSAANLPITTAGDVYNGARVQLWYPGIEAKIGLDYHYGL